MTQKIKDILQKFNSYSIIIGIKKGYNIETLPESVRNFLSYPCVRILRVIGGLAVLITLFIRNGYIDFYFPITILYIINIIALLQLTQIVVISLIKLVYGSKKILKNREEFEVRKGFATPLNRIATLTTH